jgi:hypothetical protein
VAIKVRNFYPMPVVLEDEHGEPASAEIHVKRLGPDDWATFQAGMKRMDDPPSERLLGGRQASGDEQTKDAAGVFVIPDSVIRERRLAELEPAARAAFKAADDDDERWVLRFVQTSIEEYVTLPAGQIQNEDGSDITTGAEYVRLFAANPSALLEALRAIQYGNSMSVRQKKGWRLLSDLNRSLVALEGAGPRPAAIAAPVAPADIAETVTATGSSATSSGSVDETAASSSAPVRSVH